MGGANVTAEFLPMRLWSSVSIPSDNRSWLTKCWPWRGDVAGRGKTGRLRVSGLSVSPHKFAYILYHGLNVEECAELFVVQTCGNALCCNPKHLVKDDQCAGAIQHRQLLKHNEVRKQAARAAEEAPPVGRPSLPHDLAERIARDWVRACMSRREVIETFGIEAYQLDDLKKRMAAGEFRLAQWQSRGLQQSSGVM